MSTTIVFSNEFNYLYSISEKKFLVIRSFVITPTCPLYQAKKLRNTFLISIDLKKDTC